HRPLKAEGVAAAVRFSYGRARVTAPDSRATRSPGACVHAAPQHRALSPGTGDPPGNGLTLECARRVSAPAIGSTVAAGRRRLPGCCPWCPERRVTFCSVKGRLPSCFHYFRNGSYAICGSFVAQVTNGSTNISHLSRQQKEQ